MLSKAEPGFHFSECSYLGSNQGYIRILPRGSEPVTDTTQCATPVMATVTAAMAQVGILHWEAGSQGLEERRALSEPRGVGKHLQHPCPVPTRKREDRVR